MQLVEVRPIERERWHGLKGKDAITRPVVIEALLSSTNFLTHLLILIL